MGVLKRQNIPIDHLSIGVAYIANAAILRHHRYHAIRVSPGKTVRCPVTRARVVRGLFHDFVPLNIERSANNFLFDSWDMDFCAKSNEIYTV